MPHAPNHPGSTISTYIQEAGLRVSKWGNSLAVRIPDSVVKALRLKQGDSIEIVIKGDRLLQVGRDRSREQAMARLRALKTPLPKGFRFDRDAANAR